MFSTRSAEGLILKQDMPAELSSRLDAERPYLTRGVKCSGAPKRLGRFGHDVSDLVMRNFPLSILGSAEGLIFKQDVPAELSSRWNTKG